MRNIPDAGRIGPDFLYIDGQTVRLFRRLGVPFEVSTIFRYSGGGEINESVEQATLRPVQAGFLSKPTIPFTPHMRGGVKNADGGTGQSEESGWWDQYWSRLLSIYYSDGVALFGRF